MILGDGTFASFVRSLFIFFNKLVFAVNLRSPVSLVYSTSLRLSGWTLAAISAPFRKISGLLRSAQIVLKFDVQSHGDIFGSDDHQPLKS